MIYEKIGTVLIYLLSQESNKHKSFNADQDPAFYLNADPDLAFYLNTDPDPGS
jgi:hypothetical protein